MTPLRRLFLLLIVAALNSVPAKAEDRTRWVNGTMVDVLKSAVDNDRMALIYCWEENMPSSVRFYDDTLKTDAVMAAMEAFSCFSAKKGTREGDEAINQFGIKSFPVVLFLDSAGELQDLIGGVIPEERFVSELERVLRGEGTLKRLIERAGDKSDPDNAEVRFQLAIRYEGLGDTEKAAKEFSALCKTDAKGTTLAGSRAHLIAAAKAAAGDEAFHYDWDGQTLKFRGSVKAWSLKPLYAWAKKVKNKRGAFEVWNNLGEFEHTQERKDAALAAWQKAHKGVPDDLLLDWCSSLSRRIMEFPGRRPTSQKKFALRLATHAAKVVGDLKPGKGNYAERFGDTPKDTLVAKYSEALAWAQRYNSQHGKAMTTIDKLIALDPANKDLTEAKETLVSGTWPPPPTEDG